MPTEDPSYDELLYDALNTWARSDDCYLDHVMRATSVLDVGCGTGEILCRARQAGHRGDFVGLDPSAGMLAVARAKRDDVDWLAGDAQTFDAGRTRNPAARAWEGWTPAETRTVVGSPEGEDVAVHIESCEHREPDLVDLVEGYEWVDTGETVASSATLRFVDEVHLRSLLIEAGFRVDGWYGDWDRAPVGPANPEIIVIATKP